MSREQIRELIQEKHGKTVEDRRIIDMYEKHFEERREMKLRLLKEVREEVINEEANGEWSTLVKSSVYVGGSSIISE